MKIFIYSVLIVVFGCLSLTASESACPADRAVSEGFDPFGKFHEIMAPAWHTAWPVKDYTALIAAGKEFEAAFVDIAALNPTLKSAALTKAFQNNRKQFAVVMDKYVKACAANDSLQVYDLMPELHDVFEMTASTLLPVYYPQFDGFIISFNLLYGSHLPNKNFDGIKGTSETLVLKLSGLNKETIPEELQEFETDILHEFEGMKKLVHKIKECSDKAEYENLQKYAKELSQKIELFIEKFI